VLEGIGLICKVSKNNIRWDGPGSQRRRARDEKREHKHLKKENKSISTRSANGVASNSHPDQPPATDTLKNVDPVMRDRYLKVLEDKDQLTKVESEIDALI